MNVLVTGGAGYIGSHTCKALALAGHNPVTYDNLCMGHEWAVKWGPLEVGDISNQTRLRHVINKHKIDSFIHFAAFAYVGESMIAPSKYFVNNIAGTTILLDEIINSGINKFVFSSTCATYGIPSSLPIDETLPANPVNPYGQSKLSIEEQLRWLGDLVGLRWIALRYFNAAGADSAGEVGEAHDPETHLIPLALKAAAPGDFYLSVYGNDYPTDDGTAIRDYIHVEDLACAHVKALGALIDHPVNDFLNLGTGVGVSVQQVINTVAAVTGYMPRHQFSPRRPGDPPELVANSTKAKRVLGWAPSKSTIDVIVADAWQWYKKSIL